MYGSLGPKDPPFHEATPYAPNSPYSASKASSDHLVRAYYETFGLQSTITNCSNNYGPYQFPEKLIPLTIVNILLGKPLPVYGDGLQVRDWLHVEDHCAAIALALERGRPGEVYNIGGNSETTNIEIVRTLCGLTDQAMGDRADLRASFPGSPAVDGRRAVELITHVRDRLGHDRRYAIDYRKAARELGYAPGRDLAAGLAGDARLVFGEDAVGGRHCWDATTRTGWRRITSGESSPSVKLERQSARRRGYPGRRTGYDVAAAARTVDTREVVSESEVVTEMVDAN